MFVCNNIFQFGHTCKNIKVLKYATRIYVIRVLVSVCNNNLSVSCKRKKYSNTLTRIYGIRK